MNEQTKRSGFYRFTEGSPDTKTPYCTYSRIFDGITEIGDAVVGVPNPTRKIVLQFLECLS